MDLHSLTSGPVRPFSSAFFRDATSKQHFSDIFAFSTKLLNLFGEECALKKDRVDINTRDSVLPRAFCLQDCKRRWFHLIYRSMQAMYVRIYERISRDL